MFLNYKAKGLIKNKLQIYNTLIKNKHILEYMFDYIYKYELYFIKAKKTIANILTEFI